MFRAINAARIPGASRGPLETLGDLPRQSLRERLARLAELASWLSRCEDPSSDEESVLARRREFQQLLSPSAPRSVWRFHAGWYDALRRCLEEDEALLEPDGIREPRAIRREERYQRSQALSWFPPFPARPLDTGRALPVPLLNRVASLRDVIRDTGEGGRERALEVAFEQVVRAGMPPGTDLVAIDVVPGAGGPALPAGAAWSGDATGWRWSLREPGAGLVVRCRITLSPGDRGHAIWIWTLFEEEGDESLTERIRGRSTRIEEVWEHLTGARRDGAGGLAADMAAALHQVAGQAAGRPWPEVWADIGSMAPAAPSLERLTPGVLRELLVHRSQVSSLPRRDLQRIRQIFPEILEIAPWSDIRRSLAVLDRLVARGDRRRVQDLWHAVTARAPADPSLGDIRFLLWLGRSLPCDSGHRLDLVEALLGLPARLEPQAPLRSQMARVLAGRQPTLEAALVSELLSWLRTWWSRVGRVEMAAASRLVIPVLRSLRSLGVTGDALEDLMLGPRVPGLLRDMPRPGPGVWSSREQRGAFFEELACLAGLLPPREGSRWDPEVLEWLHGPLPRILCHEDPCRFPSSYWPLLRCWLEGTVPTSRRIEDYQVDVLLSWIHALRADPVAGESAVPVEPLERAASWLRGEVPWLLEDRPSAFREIVREITSFPPGSPWHERILGALLGSSTGSGVTAAATSLVATGRLSGRPQLVDWLVTTLLVPDERRLPELTHRVALEAARDVAHGPEVWQSWLSLLGMLPPVEPALLDPALEELAMRVRHVEDPAPHARILDRILGSMSAESSLLGGFRHWMERFRTLCTPDRETPALPFDEPVRLAILASSARLDSGPLVALMRELWAGITAYLFWSCQEGPRHELVAGFHGLMHRLPWVPAEADVERVAGTLLRQATAAGQDRRLVRALELWTASLSGAAGPLPLVMRAWPGLPARLIVAGASSEWNQMLEICRGIRVEGSDAMRTALVCEVTEVMIARTRQGDAVAPDIASLGAVLTTAPARAVWARFASLEHPADMRVEDRAALIRDLHHVLGTCPPHRLNARLWSLAAAVREVDEAYAARLVQELTR